MITKSRLAIELSKLKTYEKPDIALEQYQTDSEIAAEVLWFAYMHGDIKDKIIADFGCGNGILGIGCIILGVRRVYFVDNDMNAIKILEKNTEKINKKIIINDDIKNFNKRVDIVIQNPPFGTKIKHSDMEFLKKAFTTADLIYSFHKTSTLNFIKSFSQKNNFEVTNIFDFEFPLKKTYDFQRKKRKLINVSCIRLKRTLFQ